ncbi:hypothetical protein ACN27F_32240 [Solwaraspora sp. WMMB335]|uniref:hypothetical protein n=1 Tax=Solwaraspora sp. WMMB335 TaxID=3404118 RepID=UPI003B94A4D0
MTANSRLPALTVVVVTALLTLAAASPGPAVPVKDDRFLTAQTPGVLHIEAGECFSDPFFHRGAGEVLVVYTPCDEPPIDNQVYGFVSVADGLGSDVVGSDVVGSDVVGSDGDDRWDREALAGFAWRRCGAGFAHYWSDPEESGLNFYPVLPTQETWADGDRTVMCVVYRQGGRMDGSALPAAR